MEFPIETAIVNVTNVTCPLLVVNNTPNSIKLHTLETICTHNNLHIAATAPHCALTDHEPPALDKSLPCHTDK
uniref:Uncharacterized protein n=1 Tax=Romanomermis culicivorax TaxID=13658 RepID=A0A915JYI1_ROMCU